MAIQPAALPPAPARGPVGPAVPGRAPVPPGQASPSTPQQPQAAPAPAAPPASPVTSSPSSSPASAPAHMGIKSALEFDADTADDSVDWAAASESSTLSPAAQAEIAEQAAAGLDVDGASWGTEGIENTGTWPGDDGDSYPGKAGWVPPEGGFDAIA